MTLAKTVFGAFNQGVIPTIACFNQATVPLGVDFDGLIAVMQEYIDTYVAPVWGTPAKLVKTTDFQKGAWAMVFLDDADQNSSETAGSLFLQLRGIAKDVFQSLGGGEAFIRKEREDFYGPGQEP